jgi:hypothetical protein
MRFNIDFLSAPSECTFALGLFVVMDKKSLGHHDLIVFARIVRQCVDDMVEEKLV